MQKPFSRYGTLLLAAGIWSCTPKGSDKAKSIPVDSSNVHGYAPVRYQGDNPADTTARLPSTDDSGRRENTVGDEEKKPIK